jgi:Domain of unknown function (DUF222)/HNH endonuclease
MVLKEHVDAVEVRSLEFKPSEGGIVFLSGLFDSVGAATIRSVLEPLARPCGRNDDRLRSRRLADALVELANHAMDTGVVTGSGTRRAHLQVTASLETLQCAAGAPAATVEYAGKAPSDVARRAACDASVRRVLFDSGSTVVDVGRARRVPGAAARRALEARDGGCVWPGCDRPLSWTAAHHVVHWADGGGTTLNNLVLLCHRHHWMLHEGGWSILRTDEGSILTVPPSGYRPRPPEGEHPPPRGCARGTVPRSTLRAHVEVGRSLLKQPGLVPSVA